MSIRARALHVAFELLYSRLGFLHELVGRTVYGSSWAGRRLHVVPDRSDGLILDIGCGDGRLLELLASRGRDTIGIEPSTVMSSKASARGVSVVRAASQALPIVDGSVGHVVATYPGPWIVDPQTWSEIARVIQPGGTVCILVGGDVAGGRGSRLRGLILRAAYGKRNVSSADLPHLGHACIEGDYLLIEDPWGTAIIWRGIRRPEDGGGLAAMTPSSTCWTSCRRRDRAIQGRPAGPGE